MKRKVFIGITTIVMTLMLVLSQNAIAVDLGDGIETGMDIEEVKDEFELKHFKTARGMVSHHRVGTGTYYFFNEKNNKLLYKLVVMEDEKWDEIKDMLTKKCGDPIVEKDSEGNDVYFFADGDTGFKMSKNDMFDDAWQLWYGSVSLWDEVAKENGMNEFPE